MGKAQFFIVHFKNDSEYYEDDEEEMVVTDGEIERYTEDIHIDILHDAEPGQETREYYVIDQSKSKLIQKYELIISLC